MAQARGPLSRQSHGDLARLAKALLGRPISRRTVGRILAEDAIKPWRYQHWIFPRAADFYDKASVVLDLYRDRKRTTLEVKPAPSPTPQAAA